MSDTVELKWSFNPPSFFTEDSEVSTDQFTVCITAGTAYARCSGELYDADPGIRQSMEEAVVARLRARLMFTNSCYELSGATITRFHSDDRKGVILEVKPGELKIVPQTLGIRLGQGQGRVVDSIQEQARKENEVSELIWRHWTDSTLQLLLDAIDRANRNPSTALVHFYEVREALAVRFGGEKTAKKEIGMAGSWSELGRLCNKVPVLQGRHSGSATELRDATLGELDKAKRIARDMVDGYLQHLEARINL